MKSSERASIIRPSSIYFDMKIAVFLFSAFSWILLNGFDGMG